MNTKKGFTLLELMGIMVILAAIMLVAVPTITKTLKNTDMNKESNIKETVCLATKSYLINENGSANNNDVVFGFKLVGKNYIADNLKYTSNDIDDQPISNLKITYSEPTDANKTGCSIEQLGYNDANIISTLNRIASDDDTFGDYYGNIRYRGLNPSNYVSFNNELWRIIGIVDGKVKLIRADSIGNYAWDSSTSVNDGEGINEWSQADLMNLLNNGEYWNSGSGNCYTGSNNTTSDCNFSSTGLTDNAKKMIDESVWYLGGYYISNDVTLDNMYLMIDREKGTRTVQNPSDGITRTTRWTGYVGLMYPSDYGYAADKNCSQNLFNYNQDEKCNKTGNWLYQGIEKNSEWLLTPYSNGDYYAWYVGSSGYVSTDETVSSAYRVRPVINLKSSVKITGGAGTKENPYKLQ